MISLRHHHTNELTKMAPSTIQKLKSAVTGKENDENSLITEVEKYK